MGINMNKIERILLNNALSRKIIDVIFHNRYSIGAKNKLICGRNVLLKHTTIESFGQNNHIIIGDGCRINYAVLQIWGNNGYICIGNNSKINGIKMAKTRLICGGGGENYAWG